MEHREGFTLIELMIVVVILGILASIVIPNFLDLQDRAKEAKAKGAAHTLQLAAEDYAVHHDGIYSDAAVDVGPLLPLDPSGGSNLENAFTRVYSEPQWAAAAGTAGQVGILAVVQNGVPVGYVINCVGKNNDEILVLNNGQ